MLGDTNPVVIERGVACETAEQFIRYLDRDHELWGGAPNNWVFRGHADAAWPLLPSALRKGTILGDGRVRRTAPVSGSARQAEAEFLTIYQFLKETDDIGLKMPPEADEVIHALFGEDPIEERAPTVKTLPDGTFQREHPDRVRFFRDWPQRPLINAVAVARHHGVPTRLLDWTYNPLVAAYFAARDAAAWVRAVPRATEMPSHLAVWALNRGHVHGFSMHYKRHECVLSVVHPPRSLSSRQTAQMGLFTVMRRVPDEVSEFHEIDKFLESANNHRFARAVFGSAVTMRQIVLPVVEAPKLLRKLAERFVTAGTVFPDYTGAADALKERYLWDWEPEEDG